MSVFRLCAASGCRLSRSGPRFMSTGVRYASSSETTPSLEARHAQLVKEEVALTKLGRRSAKYLHNVESLRTINSETWDTHALMRYCRVHADQPPSSVYQTMGMFHSIANMSQTVDTYARANYKEISITYKGKVYSFNSYSDTPLTVANHLLVPERHQVVCAKLNGELLDLGQSLVCDGELEFVLPDSPDAMRPLGNLGAVLLNQGLERAWRDVRLHGCGVNDDGQFFCDIQRPAELPGVRDEEMACLENFMLEAANAPYSCEMLRASQSDFVAHICKNINSLFHYDPLRAANITNTVKAAPSGHNLYMHGMYVNVHESPIALYPSVVKAAAIESMEMMHILPPVGTKTSDSVAVYRFTGRVFSDMSVFHHWLAAQSGFSVDTGNPLCRHAHWKHLRAEERAPLEPSTDYVPDAGDAVADVISQAKEAAANAAAKRSRSKRGSSRVSALFGALHNSHISIFHPLTLHEPPTAQQMEVLRAQQPQLFGTKRFSPTNMVLQWEVLKRREAQRVAANAEAEHYQMKNIMLARPSDKGTKLSKQKSRKDVPVPLSTTIS